LQRKDDAGIRYLVTTDKDWFKVRPLFESRGQSLFSLQIQYEIPNDFWYYLASRLESR
jgi:hypothetical protein